ncbi:hypothetical protein IEZ26_11195 [Nocardioides cavernae]|uniref:Uncharacterized protein n=1 Tax=Nocardioides cavernae TaxID=1921566 RepID=A0ABR8NAM2_9ACTN|nr:putative Ig domain-containing protein [Nocardioides cavernae]MBD3925190.1 hypothetical protein [Nocardioides cavernae]MBM7514432.1 hypothetical protein [Nocardioides cavernae]
MAGRRWWLLLLASALAASGGLVTVPASGDPSDHGPQDSRAQAARATKLTLGASLDEAHYGTTVRLSGKLTSGGKGLKGQKVVLRHRVSGAKAWTRVGTVTTRRKGVWRKDVQVRLRGSYMATYRGTRTYAPARSAKQQVDTFAFLTDYAVGPGGRDAYRDEPWTFTGRTAPELAGQPVHVVRGPSRISTPVATGTVGPGGAISLTHRMKDVGRYDYWLSVDGGLLMYGADSPHTSITTRAVGAPTTPSITTAELTTGEPHISYRAALVGGGGELTWSVVDGSLPPGLSLSPDGTVSGAAAAAGTWTPVVRAANAAGAATRAVTVRVPPGSLTVTTFPLDDAAVGATYPDGLYVNNGWQELTCTPCPDGADWSITSGSLPPGLELVWDDFVDPVANYVTGRPSQAGVWTFTVTGVVGQASGSRQFTIRVLPSAADLLQIAVNAASNHLPAGTVGMPYSQQLKANVASGLTWTSLGSLPPGLTLSSGGLLSGTPTLAGSGPIHVAVTDGTRYDWEQLRIEVRPAP